MWEWMRGERWVRPAAMTCCSLGRDGVLFTVVQATTGSSVGTDMMSSGPLTWMSGIGKATSTVTSLSDLLRKR